MTRLPPEERETYLLEGPSPGFVLSVLVLGLVLVRNFVGYQPCVVEWPFAVCSLVEVKNEHEAFPEELGVSSGEVRQPGALEINGEPPRSSLAVVCLDRSDLGEAGVPCSQVCLSQDKTQSLRCKL